MNKRPTTLTLAFLLAGVSVFAQGLVNFANFGGGLNAPVTNAVTMQRVEGSDFVAQLYGGRADSLESELVVLNTATPFGPAPGYFNGGPATNHLVMPGTLGAFQVRVWSGPYPSYEAAFLAGQTDPNILVGKSLLFQNATGVTTPETLTGLESFTIAPVPEASTGTLLVMGALVAVAVHKRNQRPH